MVPMIPMIARQTLLHEGRTVRPGDVFEVRPGKAAALRYQKKADFAPAMKQPIILTDPEPEIVAATVEPEAEEVKPRTKRTYRRRDLESETLEHPAGSDD